ncbi:hypothetical protein DFJ77DRAFT_32718 [Powellomyces hirtus]|nr:hypothetical protein DFJ77DRAFT_32718 [Powellomyces hirtus]
MLGHAIIWKRMVPGMANGAPTTIRMGTPPESMVDRILEPMLRAIPATSKSGETALKRPSVATSTACMISLDLDAVSSTAAFVELCGATTFVFFPHPVRATGMTRLMVIVPELPSADILAPILGGLRILRGEVFMPQGSAADLDTVKTTLARADLGELVVVNIGDSVGYVLHDRAVELHFRAPSTSAQQ